MERPLANLLGVFLGGVLLLAGCAGLAAVRMNNAWRHDNQKYSAILRHEADRDASAAQFRQAFRRVTVGDTITGKGGMTTGGVVSLLGKPGTPHHAGLIEITQKDGEKVLVYRYLEFLDATNAPAWEVYFKHGRVTGKRSY